MSHRSAVIRERNKLTEVPAFANKQRPPQVQLDTLIAFLISQGMTPGYKVQFSKEAKCIRVLSTVGPVEIPLDFSPQDARVFAAGILTACDTVEAPEQSPEQALDLERREKAKTPESFDERLDDLTYTVAAEACTDTPSDPTEEVTLLTRVMECPSCKRPLGDHTQTGRPGMQYCHPSFSLVKYEPGETP